MKINLSTKYLGLTLRNPIIVGSSGLTSSIDKVRAAAQAGAGAVVLKSIYEEQLTSQAESLEKYSEYPEAADYLRNYVSGTAMNEYIALIKQASDELTIPIIASINCSSDGEWATYAKMMEEAGAAALELNIFTMPTDPSMAAEKVEARYLAIVDSVRKVTSMPLSVKLSHTFTNVLNIIQQLYYHGVNGVVLFNRFYSADIDIEKMQVVSGGVFSSRSELHTPLRYAALSSAIVPLIDVAISSGVHTGEDVVKALFAGASAVEVCSVLYENGINYLPMIEADIEHWASKHNIINISDIIGKLNASHEKDAEIFERAQFMKYFSAR